MFVTFYSYKGGVGRSMALANVACLLAQDDDHPQRVLLWDFDLEAPGLHRLFPPQQPHKLGFVDLVYNYARTGNLPTVQDYIYSSVVEGVDVLPAGIVDQAYCEKLQQLHWPAFFTADPSDPGSFFGPFREEIKKFGYDYVLIDSRTGLNDQAGICTQVLPDLLLILFRLTAQNLDGLQHVVPMFRFQLEARKRKHVHILPIASVVSPTSSKETLENKHKAQQIFREDNLKYIRFDSDLITEERLFCLKANIKKMWPLPPIVDDYRRLCDAIREKNENDTKNRTKQIHLAIARGDFVSVESLLKPTLERRPRNPELWQILTHLIHTRSLIRKDIDHLVESILQKDEKNSYCYEWKAMRLLEDADAPESQNLLDARDNLKKALEYSTQRSRVLQAIAKIKSCQGNLEGAIKALRETQEKTKRNVQVSFDLAMLFMRMGANYFSSAIDSIQEIQGEIASKHLWLAYLYSFLGEIEKANREYRKFTDHGHHELVNLCQAHMLLIQGASREATEIAHQLIPKLSDITEVANWAEFFICAEDYEYAIKLLDERKKRKKSEEVKTALLTLAKYLKNGTSQTNEKEVKDSWREVKGWSLKELIFFRERVKKRGDQKLANRLSVVETLIREQELRDLTTPAGMMVIGPGLSSSIRSIAQELKSITISLE